VGPLWWAALAAGLAYVGVLVTDTPGPVRLLKVLPALLLAVALGPTHPVAAAGMVLSGVGDAFLLDKDRFFLHGLVAFLLGHVLFVGAFLLASGGTPSWPALGGLFVFAAAFLAVLRPKKRLLKVAAPVYALVLCAMVAAASTLGPLGVAGGLTFLVSDALLAIRQFRRDFRGASTAVIVTYYASLLTLAAALTR
jgi:uncharacterized membrane protein YhhN